MTALPPIFALVACALLAANTAGCTPAPSDGSATSDDAHTLATAVSGPAETPETLTPGPLRALPTMYIGLPSSPYSQSAPALSPDGESYFSYDVIEGLWLDQVAGGGAADHVVDRVTTEGFGHADTIPYAWADDSQSVLGVRQDTVKPSGFSLGPKVTVSIGGDGAMTPLPALAHSAGNLDGLLWVGGRGLALAEFGTKGGYYKPEVRNPRPTLAMVDARTGKVLQDFAIPEPEQHKLGVYVMAIDALIDAQGRIFTLFATGGKAARWFAWRQGAQPVKLPWNTGKRLHRKFTVTPDTKGVLIMRDLSATGPIYELCRDCPPPTPTSGAIAELRDLRTGRVAWTMNGRATGFSTSLKPAISPDGRYALIMLPVLENRRDRIALVSMKDGTVIQELMEFSNYQTTLAFSDDGKIASIVSGSRLQRYRFDD